MKAAILILSDPHAASRDEALGRLFNGLAAAYEFQQAGDQVSVIFQGAGSRWAAELAQPAHPARPLFDLVKSQFAGVSCGCADVFGAADSVKAQGYPLLKDSVVPGTTGLPSLRTLAADGYQILTF